MLPPHPFRPSRLFSFLVRRCVRRFDSTAARATPAFSLFREGEKAHTSTSRCCLPRADGPRFSERRTRREWIEPQTTHACNQSSQKRVTLRYVLLTYVEAWNDRSMQKHCMFASHAADCSFVAARAYVVRGGGGRRRRPPPPIGGVARSLQLTATPSRCLLARAAGVADMYDGHLSVHRFCRS
jgi:hypothetical protein